MALGSHINVHNTCLNILKKRGYKLWIDSDAPDADLLDCFWFAEKNGYIFMAGNPIELMGLAGIYEFKNEPLVEEKPYWWLVNEENVYDRILEKKWPDK